MNVAMDRANGDADAALERARLVRLCAQLTGNSDVAEDLAQETLLEAWRRSSRLRDPAGRGPWLAGIARNLCLRWARKHGRDVPRFVRPDEGSDPPYDINGALADDFDVEVELERHELATLLDRAMELLPAETRQVLVERYVHESPHAEIAARMGVSVDAVSMRLSRGKLLLRRALTTNLREDMAAYGFCDPALSGWQETRIWCPRCGRHKLSARFSKPPGTVSFRCAACYPDPTMTGSDYRLTNAFFAQLVGHLTRPRTVLRKTAAWAHAYYAKALAEGVVACTNCGHPAQFRLSLHDDTSVLVKDPHVLYVHCPACGEETSSSLGGLTMARPEAQQFWERHRRIRALPEREIDVDGHPAIVCSLEGVGDNARLDVVIARDTLSVIHIDGQVDTAGTTDTAGERYR